MHELSLFNALDGSLTSLDVEAFDRSLTLNILFQDRILVYDGSLLTCLNLGEHISRTPGWQSLFEVACHKGLVVPAMRDRTVSTLGEQFDRMPAHYVSPQLRGYRDRIIHAIDKAIIDGRTKPVYGPENDSTMSKGYQALVVKLLTTEALPHHLENSPSRADYFHRLWEHTARWRTDVIEAAIRRTERAGGAGLRRQAVFDELGATLGVPSEVGAVEYTHLLAVSNDSAEQRLAIEVFMRWLAQCHFVNQARTFGVAINFPVYNMDEDFVLDSILPSPADQPKGARSAAFSVSVMLPEISMLARAKPDDLIAIRWELGDTYLAKLRAWQEDPSPSRQDAVEAALKHYCEQITARYPSIAPKPSEVTLGKGPGGSLWNNALAFIKDFNVPELMKMSRLGAAIYNFQAARSARRRAQPREQALEITTFSALNPS